MSPYGSEHGATTRKSTNQDRKLRTDFRKKMKSRKPYESCFTSRLIFLSVSHNDPTLDYR